MLPSAGSRGAAAYGAAGFEALLAMVMPSPRVAQASLAYLGLWAGAPWAMASMDSLDRPGLHWFRFLAVLPRGMMLMPSKVEIAHLFHERDPWENSGTDTVGLFCSVRSSPQVLHLDYLLRYQYLWLQEAG